MRNQRINGELTDKRLIGLHCLPFCICWRSGVTTPLAGGLRMLLLRGQAHSATSTRGHSRVVVQIRAQARTLIELNAFTPKHVATGRMLACPIQHPSAQVLHSLLPSLFPPSITIADDIFSDIPHCLVCLLQNLSMCRAHELTHMLLLTAQCRPTFTQATRRTRRFRSGLPLKRKSSDG